MPQLDAIETGPGQEPVSDRPRPPRAEESSKLILVVFTGAWGW
jgi:hypothetical protein